MNIAGVGPAELLLILIVALVVFGPQRLPEIARDVGKSIGKWRKALEEIESVADVPMKEMKEMKETLDPASMEKKLQESVQKIVTLESPDDRESDQATTDVQVTKHEGADEQSIEQQAADQPANDDDTTDEDAAERPEKPDSGEVA